MLIEFWVGGATNCLRLGKVWYFVATPPTQDLEYNGEVKWEDKGEEVLKGVGLVVLGAGVEEHFQMCLRSENIPDCFAEEIMVGIGWRMEIAFVCRFWCEGG